MQAYSQDKSNNLCELSYWHDRQLVYTKHATDRARERELPILNMLPENIRLCDVDTAPNGDVVSVSLKVTVDDDITFFAVLTHDGVVITLFKNSKKEFENYQKRKQCRRQHEQYRVETLFNTVKIVERKK